MIKIVSREDYSDNGVLILRRGMVYDGDIIDERLYIEIDGSRWRIDWCQVYKMNEWREKQLDEVLNDRP